MNLLHIPTGGIFDMDGLLIDTVPLYIARLCADADG